MPVWGPEEAKAAKQLVRMALEEDVGPTGDVTSQALIPPQLKGSAVFSARANGIVAGLPAVQLVYQAIETAVRVDRHVEDGQEVQAGVRLATVMGSMKSILTGERTALNFIQRLSGVATQTHRYVEAVKGLPCQILDTRKTTPGWRRLEKYAVRCGGGRNHRLGLFDGVLIKDNHLAAMSFMPDAIAFAVERARDSSPPGLLIEIEVDNLEQLDEALAVAPEFILLDNMSPSVLREAVQRRNAVAPQVKLEASGAVTLANVREIAETGVDFISVGALTHSAPALDIALDCNWEKT